MNDLKQRIDILCAKVIAAPDGSDELRNAMQQLREALAEHVEHLRKRLADFREKGHHPRSDNS
jgi:hypothetical protein